MDFLFGSIFGAFSSSTAPGHWGGICPWKDRVEAAKVQELGGGWFGVEMLKKCCVLQIFTTPEN